MSEKPRNLITLMAAVATANPVVTNRIIEAAGELMAEDGRFNIWVPRHMKDLSEVERWNVYALSDVLFDECEGAWAEFLTLGQEERTAGQARLLEVFNSAGEQLRRIRETGRVDYRDPTMPPEVTD